MESKAVSAKESTPTEYESPYMIFNGISFMKNLILHGKNISMKRPPLGVNPIQDPELTPKP